MTIGTVLTLFLFYELRHVMLLLFISLVFAVTTAKPAAQLRRCKIPEGFAVASILIENANGFVIAPLVEGNQLNVHPLLIFVSVLVGSSLLGAGGAFVAVPAAAMVQILFNEVVIPWRSEQLIEMIGPHRAVRDPDASTERSEPEAG